ncbi:carboxypeptidase regulatory-like domain-containing protein [Acidicapsa dinghuensis]|uniref:Carboxypeptidase regulatory-like domain-containing protein n=1 Tax=Acidicapsa dinghuensis TaxID=2218256 RepID=A0ABW1EA56_9BACT|nr:carboxypeptidase regulatory-like domain-containing protein [Acidicapsa dinghuensis]
MTRHLRAASWMALLAIGCLLSLAPARAQSVYGSIFGTVTDTTGAVVPGATVTVTDETKGTVVTVVSNETGDYTVSHLIPDVYDLKVEAKGFDSYVSKGITVQADTSPRVDVPLKVAGATGQTVEVSADAVPELKTDRADVATVFDQQEVSDLPVGDQNFTNLQLLLPGAQLLGWSHAADENPQASRQIQIDGQAFGGVAYELDGTDNQDPILGIVVVNPSMDSITETKITTQNFDAELGKAVSAVMAVQTKSGSNTLHGSAYDFRTSNAFLAREPFSQGSPSAVPGGIKNKFGGSIGGRVIRDRLFFFGSYEGQRQRGGTSNVDTLPSKLVATSCLSGSGCDFSEYLANLPTGQGQIYNNFAPQQINPATGKLESQPFAGNIIPDAMVSQEWKNILTTLLPYINAESGGSLGGLDGNYKATGGGGFNSDMWAVRVDDTISQKQNAFVRFTRWTNTLSGGQMYAGMGGRGFGIGGYGGNSSSADDSVAVGTDYIINPKLITDLRLGYLRYNIADAKNDQDAQSGNALGLTGVNTGVVTTDGLPSFNISTMAGGGTQPLWGDGLNISRCNCPLIEREDQFQIVNNWTKTLGNHEIKVGADLRYGRNLRVPSDVNRSGQYNITAGPTSNNGADGLPFASMALGDVATFNRYVSTSTNAKEFQKRTFFYGQDTWRATQKLTLNLGVRWEYYFPESVNGANQGALLNMSDGYLHVAGVGGIGTNMGWSARMSHQFEPRVGIAYQLNEKTVVRAGYGRSFDIGVFGSIFGHTATQNLPVLADQSLSNAANSNTGVAFCLGSDADNPGCVGGANFSKSTTVASTGGPVPYSFPSVPSNGLLPNPGSEVESKGRQNPLRFPTLDAWNVSFQRALTPTLSLTMTYVGNKGTNTLSDGDGNSTNTNEAAIVLPGSTTAYGQTLSSITGQSIRYDPSASSGSLPDANGNTSNQNLLQRYYGGALAACGGPCLWTQQIQFDGDDQNTNFNALQVVLQEQHWKGLDLTANYQWASAFDESSGYATWSKRVAYGRDSNVRQNAFTAYGSWQVPVGHGKKYMGGANKAEDLMLGGYEVSSTVNISSGLPMTLSFNCNGEIPGSAPCYPNTSGARMKTSLTSFDAATQTRIFFPAQTIGGGIFSDPGVDNIGNNGRNTYWGPSFWNTDISVQKTFAVWERVDLKARADAYNAFNHINPGNPQTNIQSPGTINGEAPGPGPRYLELSLKATF